MFTCGLAADILFYSFSEWVLYATDPHLAEMGNIQDWAGVYPLFHWSFIPWGFYLVLAGIRLYAACEKENSPEIL